MLACRTLRYDKLIDLIPRIVQSRPIQLDKIQHRISACKYPRVLEVDRSPNSGLAQGTVYSMAVKNKTPEKIATDGAITMVMNIGQVCLIYSGVFCSYTYLCCPG